MLQRVKTMINHNHSQKPLGVNGGFTLIEILITTVLIFLFFTLIYATFFSVSRATAELQNKMKSSEISFNFLKNFREEIKCMIFEEEKLFSQKEMSFIMKNGNALYPSKITYFVKRNFLRVIH